jgi:hypothetical protein
MVGHLLRRMYADTLEAAHPRYLMMLIERLDAAERTTMHSSQR